MLLDIRTSSYLTQQAAFRALPMADGLWNVYSVNSSLVSYACIVNRVTSCFLYQYSCYVNSTLKF